MCSEILPFFRIIALGDFFPRLLCSYNTNKRLLIPGLIYTGSTPLPNKSAKIIYAMTYHAFSAQSISSYAATLVKLFIPPLFIFLLLHTRYLPKPLQFHPESQDHLSWQAFCIPCCPRSFGWSLSVFYRIWFLGGVLPPWLS